VPDAKVNGEGKGCQDYPLQVLKICRTIPPFENPCESYDQWKDQKGPPEGGAHRPCISHSNKQGAEREGDIPQKESYDCGYGLSLGSHLALTCEGNRL